MSLCQKILTFSTLLFFYLILFPFFNDVLAFDKCGPPIDSTKPYSNLTITSKPAPPIIENTSAIDVIIGNLTPSTTDKYRLRFGWANPSYSSEENVVNNSVTLHIDSAHASDQLSKGEHTAVLDKNQIEICNNITYTIGFGFNSCTLAYRPPGTITDLQPINISVTQSPAGVFKLVKKTGSSGVYDWLNDSSGNPYKINIGVDGNGSIDLLPLPLGSHKILLSKTDKPQDVFCDPNKYIDVINAGSATPIILPTNTPTPAPELSINNANPVSITGQKDVSWNNIPSPGLQTYIGLIKYSTDKPIDWIYLTNCSNNQPNSGATSSSGTCRFNIRENIAGLDPEGSYFFGLFLNFGSTTPFAVTKKFWISPKPAAGTATPIPTQRPVTAGRGAGGVTATCQKNGIEGVDTAIGCIPTKPQEFVGGLFKFGVSMGGGIALLLMAAGVFQMMTSAGNPEGVKKGSEQITNAIIGLLFIIFAVLLLQVIGVDILQIPGFGK